MNTVSANSSSVNNLKITYPSGKIETVQNLIKLYSSIETGVNKKFGESGFGGRNMNILSYIDFMLSACDAAGISTPASRDLLIFLAFQLSPLVFLLIFPYMLLYLDDFYNLIYNKGSGLDEGSTNGRY